MADKSITEAELVQHVGGRLVVTVVAIANLVPAVTARGGILTGTVKGNLHPQWRGLPRFLHFQGPFRARQPNRVRYEDDGTYRTLSE